MGHKVIVNGRFLSRRITGVERYGHELLSIIGRQCRIEKTDHNGIAGHAWEQFILPAKLGTQPARWRNSILWSPANTGPILIQNQAITIHDLSPLEHPEWFRKNFAVWYRLFLPILVKRVRIIFTPSEYVKQKIKKRFGIANAIVTPNGVDTAIFHPDARQTKLEFPKRYILFVGSIQPRKNLEGLMRAWHAINRQFKDTWLVVAGEAGRVFRGIKFFSDERIRFLNYVRDEDLPSLYANAELFVLPSFDEGFGLPILEAMACSTPVLASNGGALPETVGDSGFIFDLSKPDMLATAIRNILCDDALRLSLKEKGLARAKTFSWQHTAELIWNTLNEI